MTLTDGWTNKLRLVAVFATISIVGLGLSAGCGGRSDEGYRSVDDIAPGALTGVVTVDTFTVPAGDTTQWQGDVTVRCDTATIAGELEAAAATEAGADGGSITIEATGDVSVTGSISAGAGRAGADKATGDNGGDGGSISIASSGGDITIGAAAGGVAAAKAGPAALSSGDGGNGGSGKLGGNGGTGGHITLAAADGTLTINQGPGLLHIGNGGNGGNGSVSAAEAATFTLPERLPGAGGDSGYIAVAYTTLEGADLDEADWGEGPTTVAVLDEGVASGGKGGDAGSFRLGGDVEADARPAVSSAGAVAVDTRRATRVEGARGGNGAATGGDGQSVSVSLAHEVYVGGTNGNSISVVGGNGGDGGNSDDASLPAGLIRAVIAQDNHGGNGGDAFARAANGAEGGDAIATGGQGGAAFPWMGESAYPGKGGRAYAYGGLGGDGGSGELPGSGVKAGGGGGTGGDAIATGGSSCPLRETWVQPGGDALAVAGNGGDGGDGTPGGPGGVGGRAAADGGFGSPDGKVLRVQSGANGAAGKSIQQGDTKQYGTLAGNSPSHGGPEAVGIYSAWLSVAAGTADADANLGGPNNPIVPCDGQSMCLTANRSQLWCASYGQGVCRFSNPLTGGDRAPNVCLTNGGTLPGGPGVSVWLDETRDVLYATNDNGNGNQILAWLNASTIAFDLQPSRTMTVSDGWMIRCIVGDSASDRLFIIRDKAGLVPQLAVLDNASQRNGSAAASRVISGIQPGPYGLAYDAVHDLLYVGISDGGTLGVARIPNASTTTNAAGSPVLTGAATGINNNVTHLAVFPDTDLLFVGVGGGNLLAFEDASSLSGNVAPLKQEKLATFMVSGLVWESN